MQIQILHIIMFFIITVYGNNIELSIETISWNEYISYFKNIRIDKTSFFNFKENIAFILKNNENDTNPNIDL